MTRCGSPREEGVRTGYAYDVDGARTISVNSEFFTGVQFISGDADPYSFDVAADAAAFLKT
jgi:hypothetical protein